MEVSLVLLSPLASCLHLRSSSGLLQAPARSLMFSTTWEPSVGLLEATTMQK